MLSYVSLYIHIPFCKRKCDYCDFLSFCEKDNLIPEYIKCLNYELKSVANNLKENDDDIMIKTIYIGGGTPSYINALYIQELLETIRTRYSLTKNIEITIEINPGTVDENKLLLYKNSGINRLSIGLQSTHNNLLKQIGRIHTYKEFEQAYNIVRNIGFDNINIDIIIGLPNQTIQDIGETINKLLKLNPEHISIYSLIVEENTQLYNNIKQNVYVLPDEKLEREMYWLVKKRLEDNGYIHYEISNFAKPNFYSNHNISCWNQEEYFGFGVSSHSYVDNIRFSNINNIEEYINNCQLNKLENNFVFHEKLDYMEKMKEHILLGFRKLQGIDKNCFEEQFKIDIYRIFSNELKKLKEQNLVLDNNKFIKLTEKGIDLANLVFREFV